MMTCVIRAAALVAILPALAVAQQDVTSQHRQPFHVFARGRHGSVRLDTVARWQEVSAPASRTYDAVTRVIQHHVKLKIEKADSVASVVYNTRFIESGTLAGQPMSRWLRCGAGLTGDHADSWRITLAYAVYVEPVSTSTSRVGVALFATARNTEGVSTSAIACASTGALEREIVGKVREVVQMP